MKDLLDGSYLITSREDASFDLAIGWKDTRVSDSNQKGDIVYM